MPTSTDILIDAFTRVKEVASRAAADLTEEQLTARIDPESNTIAWLLWHLGRVQDAQISDVAGTEQAWVADGWADRFGLPFETGETGYAHSAEDVAAVRGVSAELFVQYIEAVTERTIAYVSGLSDDDLAAIVDTRWNPPVTLAARLVSILSDDLQHAGQAAYARGIVTRS